MSGRIGRPHAEHVYAGLKAAFRRVVRDAGGIESAAMVTRVGKSNLSDYENVSRPFFAPVDVVLDLESDCREPHVTRQLAHAQGYALVPVRAEASDPELAQRLAKLGEEVSQVFARGAAALSGGVEPAEARALIPEVDDVLKAASQLRGALQEMARERGKKGGDR